MRFNPQRTSDISQPHHTRFIFASCEPGSCAVTLEWWVLESGSRPHVSQNCVSSSANPFSGRLSGVLDGDVLAYTAHCIVRAPACLLIVIRHQCGFKDLS